MKTQGKYKGNYPQGAVVHYTAGRFDKGEYDALSTLKDGISKGYCYFVISNDGIIYQSFPLDSWGYHAGDSYYPGLGHGVSRKLVGIELCNAGILTKQPNNKFKTWYGDTIPTVNVRTSLKRDNIKAGTYHMYTEAQESSLDRLIMFLHHNNPTVFHLNYVLGHDEVAPDRKNDPGASLSRSMPEYRKYLTDLAKKSIA